MQQATGRMVRVAVIGEEKVGKTALILRLCLHKFVETYDPTIEDSYRTKVMLNNEPTTLDITDTAGQQQYASLHSEWIRDSEGIMLVYSVTDRSSFTKLSTHLSEIRRVSDSPTFPVVLVGNKIDEGGERTVSTEEGATLAKSWKIPFVETSAKLNYNAEVAFLILAQKLTEQNRLEDPSISISPVVESHTIPSSLRVQVPPNDMFGNYSLHSGAPERTNPRRHDPELSPQSQRTRQASQASTSSRLSTSSTRSQLGLGRAGSTRKKKSKDCIIM